MPRSPWVRLGLLICLLLIGAGVAALVGVPSPDEVRDRAEEAGPAGPILFAVTFATVGLIPVPLAPLSIAAGALFGFWVGLAAVLGGGMVAAALTFWLSRLLGRPAVSLVSGARVARLDDLVRRRGLLSIMALRLVPIMPFTICNYGCGLTGIRPRDYLVGTAVGIVPGSGAYVAIGAFGGEPGSLPFLLAIVGLAVLLVVGLTLSRRQAPPKGSR